MNTRIVQLQDCADVQPGFSTKGAVVNQPNGTHQVVMARHLTPGEPYRFIEAHHLRITPDRSVTNYQLASGDVLFMSRGSNSYPVLIESLPEPSIAPSTFFILRSHREINPAYLTWYLSQPEVEGYLGKMRTGAGTPMIPREAFMEIPVPLPDLATQEKIAEIWRLQNRELSLRKRILKEARRLQMLVGTKILRSINDNPRREP